MKGGSKRREGTLLTQTTSAQRSWGQSVLGGLADKDSEEVNEAEQKKGQMVGSEARGKQG